MMKNKNLLLLLLLPCQIFSQQTLDKFDIVNQQFSSDSKFAPTESTFTSVKFEKTECITAEQQFQLKYENAANRKKILENNPNAFKNLQKLTLFQNPFRPKAGFADYGYHTLQNQVDQNITYNGNLLDYNCGQRTYDLEDYNHQGTDYILWPYPWKKMEENTMEVVAAAPGIIVNKRNGFNDKNCDNNGNPSWNGIVIEHSDGSTASYLHFKKGSATTKEIGETVSAGEFLGIAGSSGSSTTPHLHFEVLDVNFNLIDPYMGACNTMNSATWWQAQEDYYVPRINRISTHYNTTLDTTCPNIENTYERVNFNDGDQMVLKLFYRDIKVGDVTHIKITNPDGSIGVDYSWAQNWGVFYPTAYANWVWNISGAWQTGVYNVDVTFGGNSYHTIFGVRTTLSAEDVAADNFSIYPNPVRDILYIKNFKNPESAEIIDMSGKLVKKAETEIKNGSIDVNALPKENYILKLRNTNKDIKTVKFLKN